MTKSARSLVTSKSAIFVASLLLVGCVGHKSELEVPIPVSVEALRWHLDSIPKKLLVLRGYYSKVSSSGVPHFYSTEQDARMLNPAASFPALLFFEHQGHVPSCVDGYMKAFGYVDAENEIFWVFVMVPYDDGWQESLPCWVTDFDWQNSAEYSHLAPQNPPIGELIDQDIRMRYGVPHGTE